MTLKGPPHVTLKANDNGAVLADSRSLTLTKREGRFSLRELSPAWGAAVMGTSVVSTMFASLSDGAIFVRVTEPLAVAFLVIALLVGVLVLGAGLLRWMRFPKAAKADLSHPVKGGMSATFAGGFLTLAVAMSRSGTELFGEDLSTALVLVLTAIGGFLALVFGVAFLTGIFARGDTQIPMISGSWFIPPVVTVVIPAALAPLIVSGEQLQRELLWVSWIALGMGSMLYLAITAVLIFRSATAPLPPPALAPSLLIGMGPAGLIGLNIVLLTEASVRAGVATLDVLPAAQFAGLAVWGFGLWWAIAGVVVLKRGYKKLPFTVTTWGFTFPLGAWVVAGIVLSQRLDSRIIFALALVGGATLLILWVALVLRTVRGIANRSIWS